MHAGLLRPDSAPAPALADGGTGRAGTARHARGRDGESARRAACSTMKAPGPGRCSRRGAISTSSVLPSALIAPVAVPGWTWTSSRPIRRDLSGYRLVLAPGLMRVSDPLKAAFAAFGGIALIGPRSDTKTADLSIPLPLGPDIPGLDVTVTLAESLPPIARGTAGTGRSVPVLVRTSGRHGTGARTHAGRASGGDGGPPALPCRLARRPDVGPPAARHRRRGGADRA